MNGIINIYKPKGISSFDAVRKVRKICNIKKVGHTGTLDPLACGVLPICVGKATKLVDYIMKDYKIYKTTLKLGVTTDTYDREGKVLKESEINVSEERVLNEIENFKGDIEQIPPMYSALKVNGKKLYELARKGIEVERKSRPITIYSIENIVIDMPYVTMEIKCSKGTYIRSLCYDIGENLKCGATMWELERTASGEFTKENSIKLEELSEEKLSEYILPMEKALHNFKKIHFKESVEKLLLNGVAINNPYIIKDIEENCTYRVYIEERFIGIGSITEKGFKIIKLLI